MLHTAMYQLSGFPMAPGFLNLPSQQQPGYLLSLPAVSISSLTRCRPSWWKETYYHVPPTPELFSTMIKLWHWFRLTRSIAIQIPKPHHISLKTFLLPQERQSSKPQNPHTRDPRPNDDDSRLRMILIPHRNLRPRLRSAHLSGPSLTYTRPEARWGRTMHRAQRAEQEEDERDGAGKLEVSFRNGRRASLGVPGGSASCAK